jgi:hypothetical protein
LTGAGHDFVARRFTGPLRKATDLAEQMVRFCPELVDGAEISSAADLAAGLDKRSHWRPLRNM